MAINLKEESKKESRVLKKAEKAIRAEKCRFTIHARKDFYKRLKKFAPENEMYIGEIVEKAVIEYMDNFNKFKKSP